MAAQPKFRFYGMQTSFMNFLDCVFSDTRRFCANSFVSRKLCALSMPTEASRSPQEKKFLKLKEVNGQRLILQSSVKRTSLSYQASSELLGGSTCCGGLRGRGLATSSVLRSKRKLQLFCPLSVRPLQDWKHTGFRAKNYRSRDYSSDHGNEQDQRRRLRGAVVYLPNPVNWFYNKWNLATLRRKFDPTFSEDEFLEGAEQAMSHVSQVVSEGNFEDLKGLVIEEVIDWLRLFFSTLTTPERQALAVNLHDIVLMRIRSIDLDQQDDKALAFVDSVCFALKVEENWPFLVDMGMRFQRDYSTDPPSSWVVAGITHIRLQNLAG